jgi:hypothetical protein
MLAGPVTAFWKAGAAASYSDPPIPGFFQIAGV